jgi:hypothetical protein
MKPIEVRHLLRNERAKTDMRMRQQAPKKIAQALEVDLATFYSYFKPQRIHRNDFDGMGRPALIWRRGKEMDCGGKSFLYAA